ncbi:hypothetical protein Vadar_024676 [Vaccinium darrowii]|uniref:Uncharacterized protein n=1 Tax=Vaccinium darrowii TaxID=229202 RepID=A0ACB7XJN7_9ERIC|nr:hypothetical protein Vadar_024676 [Vaccinium darrowii]
MVALNGKIYVFGGGGNPHIWAEFLDTKLIDLEEEGEVGWNYLQDSGPLGFDDLFAVALDDDKYSGKILVGSKRTGAICLYDVTCAIWETLAIGVDFRFLVSYQVVVGTTIYWIDLLDKHLCADDIVQRTKYSIPILDFKISKLPENFIECPDPDLLRLVHLADDDFCILWVDRNYLHCSKIRVYTTPVLDAYVLCCHLYSFDHSIALLHCVPVQPSLSKVHIWFSFLMSIFFLSAFLLSIGLYVVRMFGHLNFYPMNNYNSTFCFHLCS